MDEPKMNASKLEILQISELVWEGRIGNEVICRFEYFLEDNKFWINIISTEWKYKSQGFGTQMICAALKVYNEIYVSTGTRRELNAKGLRGDSRYESDRKELTPFVNKLVERGVLKKEWIQNPYI